MGILEKGYNPEMANNCASLNLYVEAPPCALMNDQMICDVPFLRSLFPAEQRAHCAANGQCVVRQLEKVDGYAAVSLFDCQQARHRPIPVEKIRVAVEHYCEAHHA